MNMRSHRFRKPDIMIVLTLLVVLGVIITTRLQAAELSSVAMPSSPFIGVVPWVTATTRSAITDFANFGSQASAIITGRVSKSSAVSAADRLSGVGDPPSAPATGLKLAVDFSLPYATRSALRDAEGIDGPSLGASPMAPPQGLLLFLSLRSHW